MKTRRKQKNRFDAKLFDLFRTECNSDAECEEIVKGARKAFSFLKGDQELREEFFNYEEL